MWRIFIVSCFLLLLSNGGRPFLLPTTPCHRYVTTTSTLSASSSTSASTAQKTTLTDETTWRLRFILRGVATEQGKKVDEIFSVTAHFLEDVNYEPPQGSLRQLLPDDESGSASGSIDGEEVVEAKASSPGRLKLSRSRWQLSEDPNDRKDGLWVWGLFQEPLYPYMLLQLETEAVPLPGDSGDSIQPLKLYAQINHKRDSELGVILEGSDLKVRQKETIKADPFGAANVDLYDEVTVGTLSIQPVETV